MAPKRTFLRPQRARNCLRTHRNTLFPTLTTKLKLFSVQDPRMNPIRWSDVLNERSIGKKLKNDGQPQLL